MALEIVLFISKALEIVLFISNLIDSHPRLWKTPPVQDKESEYYRAVLSKRSIMWAICINKNFFPVATSKKKKNPQVNIITYLTWYIHDIHLSMCEDRNINTLYSFCHNSSKCGRHCTHPAYLNLASPHFKLSVATPGEWLRWTQQTWGYLIQYSFSLSLTNKDSGTREGTLFATLTLLHQKARLKARFSNYISKPLYAASRGYFGLKSYWLRPPNLNFILSL